MDEKISVNVEVSRSATVTRKGTGEWDGDDLDHYHDIRGWYREESGPYRIDPSKQAYAVYMVYSTGDSFHHESGIIEVMMVNQDFEKAEQNVEAIKKACESGEEQSSIKLLTDDGTVVRLSNPAAGYFERLQDADCVSIGKTKGPR